MHDYDQTRCVTDTELSHERRSPRWAPRGLSADQVSPPGRHPPTILPVLAYLHGALQILISPS
jgi:hypothetical protein